MDLPTDEECRAAGIDLVAEETMEVREDVREVVMRMWMDDSMDRMNRGNWKNMISNEDC
jgi:hypothetical protein